MTTSRSRETTPPRTPELLLETLGAEPHLRDAIVGDLAEEYAWIADTVDARTARRWYWRQALAAVPLLVRSSLRVTGWRDLRRRLGIAVSAYAMMLVLAIVGALVVRVLFDVAGSERGIAAVVAFTAARLVLGAVMPVLGGYLAAALDDRTPIVSAATLAVLWVAAVGALRLAEVAGPFSTLRVVIDAAGVSSLIVLGGFLRLRQLTHRPRSGGTSTA